MNPFGIIVLNGKKEKNNMTLKSLDIHLTNRCNLKCRHCLYNSAADNPDNYELTTTDFKKIFNDFFKLSRGKGSVNFLGGEPLIRKDFFEIVGASKKLGLKTNLVSNFNYSEKILEKIINFGFDRISLGIHGNEKNHDWIRNNNGDYKNSLEKIKIISDLENNKPHLNLTTVLHKKNLDNIEHILNLANSFNVDSLSFFFFTSIGRGLDYPNLMVDPKDWLAAKNRIIKWVSKNKPKFSIRWEKAYSDIKDKNSSIARLCSGRLISSLEVRSNGDIYFCGILSSIKSNIIGNLRKNNLIEIYNSILIKETEGVLGCTGLALLNYRKTGNHQDPRSKSRTLIPSCPYILEKLWPIN